MNPTTQLIEAIWTRVNLLAARAHSCDTNEVPEHVDDAHGLILLAIADAVDAQNGEDLPTTALKGRSELADFIVDINVARNAEKARWRQWAGELRERAGGHDQS